jgi:hypothetical protein
MAPLPLQQKEEVVNINKTFKDTVLSWPEVPLGSLHRGRVTVMLVQHDNWCPAANSGNGNNCTCSPTMSRRLAPKHTD